MNAASYFPTFLGIVAFMSAIMAWRFYMSPTSALSDRGSRGSIYLCIPLSLVLALWIGMRPLDPMAFGDTFSYAHSYMNVPIHLVFNNMGKGEWLFAWIGVACKLLGLDVHGYFTVIAVIYVMSGTWAIQRFVPKNPLLGLTFLCGSLMYFTFATNGIRNGMACHMLLLGMSFFLQSRYIIAAIIGIAAFGTHNSVVLPIASMLAARWVITRPRHAIYIWLGSIVLSLIGGNAFIGLFSSLGFDERMESYGNLNTQGLGFSGTGFRWDFLLYSAMPVVMGYVVLVRRGMRENWYRVLFCTYCMANAFWVLVIRAAFTNRFAYLSWFMYPLVIADPLLMMRVWPDQDRRTAQILLAYVGFTIIMNTLYW